ncbi:MAG: protein-export membrane protein SecF [Candidatus Wildermuthbacteria bacterium RIFCSPHIGHO2_01_FULL_47_27]|uniref:Protein-export membrane protein SecF n=1 Tax=Candidatus Wildermuthbacteria bacterium RIFCSPHIGHO2_02_FULL_47_17 TaxID=1802452 RepID=A0A1G2R254_9BACT|nr:MAG: Protein translocase subunit SecF [Parcubacteria group bacterium GW2011_GWA2_47_9]OHA64356.1 MAG: protein-export membrane protein SecF [Candidatus Wildermuthbacteria bacterium RIFCSPHIGHO2_01_FULL_47_27]OHA66936.1 MAG: protein-export membrane protein SecF [Candidatus Wildermuthbacteria bacterium RIFCSPHIGHO2_02_FULL_47_17]OHA74770.1 MAG: protein-export membrane protein SecF [Candidatus Wildermuthbacteria bacterium RIFCSPLOWO2_02_FULL_47_10]
MFFNFLRYRHIYYLFSGLLILGSIVALAVFGLRFGIDFNGGSVLEIEYQDSRPANQEIQDKLADLNLGEMIVQPIGDRGVMLRMRDLDEDTHQRVLQKLGAKEQRFESIGPVIGRELKKKTQVAIALATAAIMFYIAFAFRKVSRPVPSWQYGLIAAVVAFFHDVLIPLGAFAVLGKYVGAEINIPIIAALLTVLGYSIQDTVVVFDRIRENLLRHRGVSFEDTINFSLNQTFVRSLNVSLTALLVLFAIFFFGGETLKYFSLALIIGIASGTYSSIFLASPLLITWQRRRQRPRG